MFSSRNAHRINAARLQGVGTKLGVGHGMSVVNKVKKKVDKN